ncbi:MAG: hydrogenase maturation nickel metallochaperone HypA [Armatimonadetes bacterium]|nr:hydrogenase maturation nickel metallochaperone HypA [Armatimonadota bacterium]
MHEVGIILNAIELAVEKAEAAGATSISRLCLRVGALSGVVPDALEFGFDLASKGTMADHAKLEIVQVPARCRCANGCGEFEPDSPVYSCPACGAISSIVLQGKELDLVEIDVN